MKQKLPPIYTDIDLSFNIHPITKDLSKKVNQAAIVQSIKLLVLSNSEEILWSPQIGGNISNALFKLNDPLFRLDVERRITESIVQHEPRCELKLVRVYRPEGQPQSVKVRVEFYILNVEEAFVEDIDLFRPR